MILMDHVGPSLMIVLLGKIYLFMLYAKLHTVFLGLHIHSLNWTLVQRLLFNRPLGLCISIRTLQIFYYAHLLNSVEIKLFNLL